MAKNFDRIALTLAVMPVGVAVTPAEIEASVNNGPYAAKYISFLRRLGFEVSVQKDGRNVVSYTIVSEPADAADHRKLKESKPKAAPAAKAPNEKKVKVVATAKPKKAKVVKQKAAAAKPKREKSIMDANYDEVEKTFGSSGAIGNYSVDPDWDSMDGIDVGNFLK